MILIRVSKLLSGASTLGGRPTLKVAALKGAGNATKLALRTDDADPTCS